MTDNTPLPWAIVLLPEPDHPSTGIGLVRCLGREGVPVMTASSSRRPMSASSRYVRRHLVLPSMQESVSAYLEALVEQAREFEGRPILFVSTDEHCVMVNSHAETLREYLAYPYLDALTLHQCIDKHAMFRAATEAGVSVPMTAVVSSQFDADKAIETMAYPCVVKPASWVKSEGDECGRNSEFITVFGQKAVRAQSRDELAGLLDKGLTQVRSVVIQQEIPGACRHIWGVSVYANRTGDVWISPALQKTRQYPSDFGTGCCMTTLDNPPVARLASALVRGVSFEGIAEIELKQHEHTGELYLMEINPRPGTWITAASANGVNTPYIAYCDLAGLPVPKSGALDSQVVWVDSWYDALYFLRYHRGDHTGRTLSWREWRGSLRPPREGAYFTPDDPLPGVRRGWDLSCMIARAGLRRLTGPLRKLWSRSDGCVS